MRKRLLAEIRAHQKLGTAAMFEDVDSELKHRIDSLIKELKDRITRAIASDHHLSETAIVLRSIPGIGLIVSTMLIAEMPEIGTITGDLPPDRPSFITRVCRFEIGSRGVVSWQARRARSHQGAQASGALRAASGCRARSAA